MSSKTAWDIFLVVAIAVVVVLFLEPLLLAFAATLVGVLLGSFADVVARHTPLSRRWSLVAVILVLIGAVVALIVVAAPDIATQVDLLVDKTSSSPTRRPAGSSTTGGGAGCSIVRTMPGTG